MGGFYKILDQVLANWLKKMVIKVVSKFQIVFMEGKQILDVMIIANETIDLCWDNLQPC